MFFSAWFALFLHQENLSKRFSYLLQSCFKGSASEALRIFAAKPFHEATLNRVLNSRMPVTYSAARLLGLPHKSAIASLRFGGLLVVRLPRSIPSFSPAHGRPYFDPIVRSRSVICQTFAERNINHVKFASALGHFRAISVVHFMNLRSVWLTILAKEGITNTLRSCHSIGKSGPKMTTMFLYDSVLYLRCHA